MGNILSYNAHSKTVKPQVTIEKYRRLVERSQQLTSRLRESNDEQQKNIKHLEQIRLRLKQQVSHTKGVAKRLETLSKRCKTLQERLPALIE